MNTPCANCPLDSKECPAITDGQTGYCNIFNPDIPGYDSSIAINAANDLNNRFYKSKKPSMLQMISTFSKSWIEYLKGGMKDVYPGKQIARIQECLSCDRFLEKERRCEECGCFIEIKTKWAHESCPLGKWGPEENGYVFGYFDNFKPVQNEEPCVPCGQK